jgi:hypothetical protein
MIAGVPSIVLALFGLLIFAQSFFGFLSQSANSGSVTAQSFLVAGIVMAALALPLIVAATREALAQLPGRLREASYALGKTSATTIWRVLLPSIRTGIASGIVLGMGRIVGDTAIITVLLGTGYRNDVGSVPISALRGTADADQLRLQQLARGGALTRTPRGCSVLLMSVLTLNALVTRHDQRPRADHNQRPGDEAGGAVKGISLMPRPRRIVDRHPHVAAPRIPPTANGMSCHTTIPAVTRQRRPDPRPRRRSSGCASNRSRSPTAHAGWCAT